MANGIENRVRAARKEAGLSREQVAQALGLSMSTIIRIETGRADIGYRRLVALAELTGKPVGFFVGNGDVAA